MKKFLLFSGLIAGLVLLLLALYLFIPEQHPVMEDGQTALSEPDTSTTLSESSSEPEPEIAEAHISTLPPYVRVTQNQLDFQVSPKKQYNERKREEFEHRFEKLTEREQQLGIVVEQGTPLVLTPPEPNQH